VPIILPIYPTNTHPNCKYYPNPNGYSDYYTFPKFLITILKN